MIAGIENLLDYLSPERKKERVDLEETLALRNRRLAALRRLMDQEDWQQFKALIEERNVCVQLEKDTLLEAGYNSPTAADPFYLTWFQKGLNYIDLLENETDKTSNSGE